MPQIPHATTRRSAPSAGQVASGTSPSSISPGPFQIAARIAGSLPTAWSRSARHSRPARRGTPPRRRAGGVARRHACPHYARRGQTPMLPWRMLMRWPEQASPPTARRGSPSCMPPSGSRWTTSAAASGPRSRCVPPASTPTRTESPSPPARSCPEAIPRRTSRPAPRRETTTASSSPSTPPRASPAPPRRRSHARSRACPEAPWRRSRSPARGRPRPCGPSWTPHTDATLIANVRTGPLLGLARAPGDRCSRTSAARTSSRPPPTGTSATSSNFAALVRGPAGDLVVVRDTYQELGLEGHHLQPPDRVAAALRRDDGHEGGVLAVVESSAAPGPARAPGARRLRASPLAQRHP